MAMRYPTCGRVLPYRIARISGAIALKCSTAPSEVTTNEGKLGECRLKQTQRFEARVTPAPDHEMIVDFDLERLRRADDFARHLNVAARRRRIAARMVVHEDER